ncbi:serine protease [Gordonia sp. (in: high G+C Gram-positive bacteria)]|uniref:S1 family peptidase n=1 Tax=Gordonia sp. (in: high G+C Gram-positive bacteria) TaxID=84139 RepID=UPI0026317E55|nr:serine protease [Gordonia sp. (in: high G+C Gram-positive bacteria)]HMS73624.1 serine protease [Gordonia sp. (in: high G+C Gram-positive bacteria)]
MLRRIIGVAVVSGLLFAGMAGPGLISGVPVAVADQGNAAVIEKVGSSLVYVRTRFMGRVKVTDAVGASWSELLVVNGQCSGYVVDPRGYIVTAGHCVDGDDDGIRNALRMKSVIDVARTLGKDSDWLRKKYAQAVAEKWPVIGAAGAGFPMVEVSVRQPEGPAQVLRSWAVADVLDYQRFTAGDNAVIKVNPVKELPALVVSDETPTLGESVISVGFPGAVQPNAAGAEVPQPSYKTGTVSSRQVDDSGIARTEVSATMGSGMSGGPTVNSAGEVIGTNSCGNSLPQENDSFNFITDNLALRGYLSSNNIVLAQPESEGRWSVSAWAAPVAGAAAVVVAVVVVIVFIAVRLRRRCSRMPAPVHPPGVPPQSPYYAPQFAGWSAVSPIPRSGPSAVGHPVARHVTLPHAVPRRSVPGSVP